MRIYILVCCTVAIATIVANCGRVGDGSAVPSEQVDSKSLDSTLGDRHPIRVLEGLGYIDSVVRAGLTVYKFDANDNGDEHSSIVVEWIEPEFHGSVSTCSAWFVHGARVKTLFDDIGVQSVVVLKSEKDMQISIEWADFREVLGYSPRYVLGVRSDGRLTPMNIVHLLQAFNFDDVAEDVSNDTESGIKRIDDALFDIITHQSIMNGRDEILTQACQALTLAGLQGNAIELIERLRDAESLELKTIPHATPWFPWAQFYQRLIWDTLNICSSAPFLVKEDD